MTPGPDPLPSVPLPGLARSISDHERGQINNYLNLLIKWNRTQRLVGSGDRHWLIENVILDSLCFLEVLPRRARRIADVGSGAGIPGLPIAIVRTDLDVTLIEGRQRRVSFLSTAVRELGLSHVTVVGARVETLATSHAARFDAVLMRCAGNPDAMLPLVFPLVRRGGSVLASSGPSTPASDTGEPVRVRTVGGKVRLFRRFLKQNLET